MSACTGKTSSINYERQVMKSILCMVCKGKRLTNFIYNYINPKKQKQDKVFRPEIKLIENKII